MLKLLYNLRLIENIYIYITVELRQNECTPHPWVMHIKVTEKGNSGMEFSEECIVQHLP